MAFGYYASITVDNTKVGGGANLSNYPVLVKGTYDGTGGEPNLKDNCRADGYDIYFYDDDAQSTKYDHEMINYDNSTGTYIAWVRIPTLDHDDDTVFYMHYGDASVSSDASTTSTWTSKFTTVVHGHETLNSTESSQSGHALSDTDTTIGATDAKVWRTRDFNGSTSYTNIAGAMTDINADSSKTLQLWVTCDTDTEIIWSNDSDTEFYFFNLNTNEWRYRDQLNGIGAGFIDSTNASWSTGTPYLIHCTNNSNVLDIYQDGVKLNKTGSTTGAHNVNGGINLGIYNDESSFPFDGRMEEFRISTDLLTAGWITTDHNCMNSPSTFYTMGSEVEVPSVGIPASRRIINVG